MTARFGIGDPAGLLQGVAAPVEQVDPRGIRQALDAIFAALQHHNERLVALERRPDPVEVREDMMAAMRKVQARITGVEREAHDVRASVVPLQLHKTETESWHRSTQATVASIEHGLEKLRHQCVDVDKPWPRCCKLTSMFSRPRASELAGGVTEAQHAAAECSDALNDLSVRQQWCESAIRGFTSGSGTAPALRTASPSRWRARNGVGSPGPSRSPSALPSAVRIEATGAAAVAAAAERPGHRSASPERPPPHAAAQGPVAAAPPADEGEEDAVTKYEILDALDTLHASLVELQQFMFGMRDELDDLKGCKLNMGDWSWDTVLASVELRAPNAPDSGARLPGAEPQPANAPLGTGTRPSTVGGSSLAHNGPTATRSPVSAARSTHPPNGGASAVPQRPVSHSVRASSPSAPFSASTAVLPSTAPTAVADLLPAEGTPAGGRMMPVEEHLAAMLRDMQRLLLMAGLQRREHQRLVDQVSALAARRPLPDAPPRAALLSPTPAEQLAAAASSVGRAADYMSLDAASGALEAEVPPVQGQQAPCSSSNAAVGSTDGKGATQRTEDDAASSASDTGLQLDAGEELGVADESGSDAWQRKVLELEKRTLQIQDRMRQLAALKSGPPDPKLVQQAARQELAQARSRANASQPAALTCLCCGSDALTSGAARAPPSRLRALLGLWKRPERAG